MLALGVSVLLYLRLGLNRALSLHQQYQFDWWVARLLPSKEADARLKTSQARLLAWEAGVAAATALDIRDICTGLAVETSVFSHRVTVPDALLRLDNDEARLTFQFAYGQTLGRKLGTRVLAYWRPGQAYLMLEHRTLLVG